MARTKRTGPKNKQPLENTSARAQTANSEDTPVSILTRQIASPQSEQPEPAEPDPKDPNRRTEFGNSNDTQDAGGAEQAASKESNPSIVGGRLNPAYSKSKETIPPVKRKRLILVHDDDDSVPTDPSDDETQLTLCSMKRAIYRHARWCPFIRINKRILNLHRRLEANIVTHDDEDSDDPQQPKPAAKKQRLNTEQRPTVTEIDKQDKQDNRDKDQQPLASNQPSVARGAQAEIASRRRPQQRKASKRPEAKIKPSQSKAKASSTKNAEDVEGNDVTIADTENRSFEDNGSTINLATAKRAVGKEDGEENETTPGDVANTPIAKGRSITLKKGNVSKAPSFEPRSAKPDDDLTDTEESDKPAKEGSEVGSAPPPRRPRAASTQKRGRKGKK